MTSLPNGFVSPKQADGTPFPDSLESVTGTESMPFGERLRRYRLFRQLSISALARAAKLAKSHVSMLEAGKRQPGYTAAWRLAGALGIPGVEVMLFMFYAHMARETAPGPAGGGLSLQEYLRVMAINSVWGGAFPIQRSMWTPKWGRKRIESFTPPGIIAPQPFTRAR